MHMSCDVAPKLNINHVILRQVISRNLNPLVELQFKPQIIVGLCGYWFELHLTPRKLHDFEIVLRNYHNMC
jgi:hypothetical protein